jgi:hypothetical protein
MPTRSQLTKKTAAYQRFSTKTVRKQCASISRSLGLSSKETSSSSTKDGKFNAQRVDNYVKNTLNIKAPNKSETEDNNDILQLAIQIDNSSDLNEDIKTQIKNTIVAIIINDHEQLHSTQNNQDTTQVDKDYEAFSRQAPITSKIEELVILITDNLLTPEVIKGLTELLRPNVKAEESTNMMEGLTELLSGNDENEEVLPTNDLFNHTQKSSSSSSSLNHLEDTADEEFFEAYQTYDEVNSPSNASNLQKEETQYDHYKKLRVRTYKIMLKNKTCLSMTKLFSYKSYFQTKK